MARLLSMIITYAGVSVVGKILVALGVGFATYGAITALLDALISQVQQYVGVLSSDLLQVLAIWGLFEAVSIIASAMTAVAAVKSVRVFIARSS